MLRTVTLDVSERVRVSLTYPGASKVVLAMNDDVQCAVSQPIVLELEPLRAAYESSNSEAKGGPPAGAGVPRMTAPLATAPLLGPSLRVDDELENAKMSAGRETLLALVSPQRRPPACWRTPGIYTRKRADDDLVEIFNFPVMSPTRPRTQT